eukprot:9476156-Pyramimonas_sp.AAC.1
MQDLANQCHAHAEVRERATGKKRLGGFYKWARGTLTSGPAPLFNMTRLRTWTHNQVSRHGAVTSRPQAIADSQMDMWNDTWEGKSITRQATRGQYYMDGDGEGRHEQGPASAAPFLDTADADILAGVARLPPGALPVPTVDE